MFGQREIERRVRHMAGELSAFMAESNSREPWVVLGVLRGAFIFMADLVRHLTVPVELDFIRIQSYGQSDTSSGNITLLNEPALVMAGRSVLLVDDILDTGNSMVWLVNYLNNQKVENIRTCVLLDKPARRLVEVAADYVGFVVPPLFVVGYGLDMGQKYRQLPGIYQLP